VVIHLIRLATTKRSCAGGANWSFDWMEQTKQKAVLEVPTGPWIGWQHNKARRRFARGVDRSFN